MGQRQYVKKDGCDELIKDINPHFPETNWIANRTNAEKSAYLHYRGASMGLRRWGIYLQCRRLGFHPWVRKIPWRRKCQPSPVFLPKKIPCTEKPGRSTWCCKESDTAEQLTLSRHGETAGKQNEDFKMIQREKMDYIQKNEKAVNWHLDNRGSQRAEE